MGDRLEVAEELGAETALRYDSQPGSGRIKQLDISKIGRGGFDDRTQEFGNLGMRAQGTGYKWRGVR